MNYDWPILWLSPFSTRVSGGLWLDSSHSLSGSGWMTKGGSKTGENGAEALSSDFNQIWPQDSNSLIVRHHLNLMGRRTGVKKEALNWFLAFKIEEKSVFLPHHAINGLGSTAISFCFSWWFFDFKPTTRNTAQPLPARQPTINSIFMQVHQ